MAQYDNLDDYNWLAAEVDRHETGQAIDLGTWLLEVLAPDTVIDIGCSSGIYLVPFKRRGCYVLGVDGASGVGKHLDRSAGEFGVVDLREPWDPPQLFDLAMCIEVGEHVPPQYADTVVQTVAKCSNTILWCAAKPGQGGENHVNEQPKEYWIQKFSQYGFILDTDLTDRLHQHVDHLPTTMCWLSGNAIFLVRKP